MPQIRWATLAVGLGLGVLIGVLIMQGGSDEATVQSAQDAPAVAEPALLQVPPKPPEPPPQQANLPPATTTPDLPAWQRYAVAVPDAGARPMIAIVLDDVGVAPAAAERAIALPGPLTLSFMTYARDLPALTAQAHAAGHELMLHVPMEPQGDGVNPGENVLRADLGEAELRRRLDWGLSRFEGYVGINNHMGSKFTASPEGMRLVMTALKDRRLLFLDSRTTAATVGATLAREMGVPHASRDVFLDDTQAAISVRAKLAETEAIARRNGFAIAIGHPHEATIEALKAWLQTLADRGFILVPVSAIVRRNVEVAG